MQGEGYGKRGLTLDPPKVKTYEENGKRIFEYEHILGAKEIHGGRPLCKVRERLVITPTGEIHVVYDCEWLESLRWQTFSHLIIFNKKNCRDREYLVRVEDRFFTGKLEKGAATERRIRNLAFDQLTVRAEAGPVHFVWDEKAQCSFHWGGGISLSIAPKNWSYHHRTIYKGQKERIAYRILLPVSQQ